jgi:hypothetical protein
MLRPRCAGLLPPVEVVASVDMEFMLLDDRVKLSITVAYLDWGREAVVERLWSVIVVERLWSEVVVEGF